MHQVLGQHWEAGLLSPILEMKKPRPRQVKSLTREQCAARKYRARTPRHIFRACSDSPVPIQLWEHWKWDGLCPLQEWLGGAVCWALSTGEGQTRLPLSLYGVGHVLPGSGGCIRMIELSIYFHSLGTILLSPEEGPSFPYLLRGTPRASSGAVAPPLA